MSLVLSVAGVWFGALFLVALAITSWWKCVRCGEPADHPIHFACRFHREPCRAPHHRYAKPAWPFVVLGALMVVDVVLLGIAR